MTPKYMMIVVACMAAMALLAWPAIALLTGPAPAENGRIAFGVSQDGSSDIYVMDASPGAVPVRLAGGPANDFSPAWSPGGAIGFVSDRDGMWEIYAMTANGTGQARLTGDLASDCTYDDTFTWSPDGAKIAFVRDSRLWLVNADGTGETPYAPVAGDVSSLNPAWSPNGTRIVFDAGPDRCERGIWVMNADGTGLFRLMNTPGSDQDPAWSPDGTRLAFTSYRDGNWEIYVRGEDGTETRLTESAARDVEPCWSPDGKQIAFVRRSTDGSGTESLCVADADGDGETCLLEAAPGCGVSRPSWAR